MNKLKLDKSVTKSDLTIDAKFGKLTVVKLYAKFVISKRGYQIWSHKCRCDCGTSVVYVTSDSLISGNTSSCGCLKGVYVKSFNEQLVNQLITNYKSSARKRNITWKLSTSEVAIIIIGSCYYCGREPSNFGTSVSKYRKKFKINNKLCYNGIDRLDNSKPYTITNCVPCCKFCNYAKRDLKLSEFIDNIKRTYEYLELNKSITLLEMAS